MSWIHTLYSIQSTTIIEHNMQERIVFHIIVSHQSEHFLASIKIFISANFPLPLSGLWNKHKNAGRDHVQGNGHVYTDNFGDLMRFLWSSDNGQIKWIFLGATNSGVCGGGGWRHHARGWRSWCCWWHTLMLSACCSNCTYKKGQQVTTRWILRWLMFEV